MNAGGSLLTRVQLNTNFLTLPVFLVPVLLQDVRDACESTNTEVLLWQQQQLAGNE